MNDLMVGMVKKYLSEKYGSADKLYNIVNAEIAESRRLTSTPVDRVAGLGELEIALTYSLGWLSRMDELFDDIYKWRWLTRNEIRAMEGISDTKREGLLKETPQHLMYVVVQSHIKTLMVTTSGLQSKLKPKGSNFGG
jgi:hypothetical protein